MAQPTQTDVHVDAVLTNISTAYMNELDSYVAGRVFPTVTVSKQTDKYFTYTKADWFRDEAKIRADGTESVGSGYGLSTATYYCDVVAIHKDIGDQTRANADAPINLDADAARFVTQRLLLQKENKWVSDAFTTSVWDTDSTPSNLWDVYATSDPIGDIEGYKDTIRKNTGMKANTLILGATVLRYLRHHPDIVDRYKYTSSASITEEMLGAVFGIDRVLEAPAIENTGLEGETAAYAYINTATSGLLCYVNPNPGLLAPSAGYTFVWSGIDGGLGGGIGVSRMRMDHLRAERIEGQIAYDHKIVGTDLGNFINGATS